MVVALAMALSSFSARASERAVEFLSASDVEQKSEDRGLCFDCDDESFVSLVEPSTSSQSVTPAARMLVRTLRSMVRECRYNKAASAIDSSMSTQRYGLYNHRVLFVSLARLYYLNRLEILRI